MNKKYIFLPFYLTAYLAFGVANASPYTPVLSVPNIATLQALGASAAQYPVVNVTSAVSGGVGGGMMYWNGSSTATTTLCGPYAATGVATGRYFRVAGVQTIDDCQAISDNSTDNTAAFQAAANQGSCVRVPAEGTGYAIGTASANGSINMGNGSCFKLDAGAQMLFKNVTATSNFNVQGSNITVEGGYISCATANLTYCWAFPNNGTSHGRIANTYYINGVGTSGLFLGINTGSSGSPTTDWRITGNTLDSFNHTILFGFGTSTTMAGGGWRIDHNYIINAVRSAITINTPNGSAIPAAWVGVTIDHNNISVVNGSTGAGASGSCLELAAAESVIFDGNVCNQSYIEAVHIEDNSQDIKITNNIFNNIPLAYNGVLILSGSSTRVPNGVQINNNQFFVVSGSPTNSGIFDDVTNGNPYNLQISNNQFYGFATGARIPGTEQFFGNMINGSAVCINVTSGQDQKDIHDNQCRNTSTTGVSFTNGGVIGFTAFDGTLPTTLISTTATSLGGIDGLSLSGTLGSTTSGANTLYNSGTSTLQFSGIYSVNLHTSGGTSGYCSYSSYVLYNGTYAELTGTAIRSKAGAYTTCLTNMSASGVFTDSVTTSNTGASNWRILIDGVVLN